MPGADPPPITVLVADLALAWADRRRVRGDGAAPDQEPLGQQVLYERWLKRPAWRLWDEAIPLLLGVDPAAWPPAEETGLREADERVRAALRASVTDRGGLRISDPGAEPADWCVEPAELYRFATGRGILVPGPFAALMDFILRTVKSPASGVFEPRGHAATLDPSVRERLLGAALNVLAKCPAECYDSHGLASGAHIAERIAAQALRWFDAPEPPMSRADMAAFIDRWLE